MNDRERRREGPRDTERLESKGWRQEAQRMTDGEMEGEARETGPAWRGAVTKRQGKLNAEKEGRVDEEEGAIQKARRQRIAAREAGVP